MCLVFSWIELSQGKRCRMRRVWCGGTGLWVLCDFCKGKKNNVKLESSRVYHHCPTCNPVTWLQTFVHLSRFRSPGIFLNSDKHSPSHHHIACRRLHPVRKMQGVQVRHIPREQWIVTSSVMVTLMGCGSCLFRASLILWIITFWSCLKENYYLLIMFTVTGEHLCIYQFNFTQICLLFL